MRQKGLVKALDGDSAVVAVQRMSACDGCHKVNPGMHTDGDSPCHECSMFPVDTELSVSARNEVGALVGDRVEVECATERVLGYAAAVFVLPLILALLGGVVGALLSEAMWATYLGAMAGFVGAFVFVKLVIDRQAKEKTVYTVVRILT